MKTVAIVQSCYIPWKGYFDLINFADEFILYDDAQYTKNDWRNRNRIKTPQGPQWLTVPVRHTGLTGQRIEEARATDMRWPEKHWRSLEQSYRRAPYFGQYSARFEAIYRGLDESRISRINRRFIEAICATLGVGTKISWSTDYSASGRKTERVVELCRQAGARRYLSGPSARQYLDEAAFERAGIELTYIDYSGYPEYPQLYPPFEHAVTVLDLLFHTGPDATRYMKSFFVPAATGRA